jgi:hypothetical protein
MSTLLRQLFVAMLGGVVAAAILLAANHVGDSTNLAPTIALAQTNTTISSTSSVDEDARKVINYQGQVFNPNNGSPYVNTTLNFSFRLYNNAGATNQVYNENKSITTNADGFFNTNIGDIASFGNVYNIFNGQELYLRVYINNQELGPLQPITFVPYAFWSEQANRLDNYDAGDFPKIIARGVINADGSRRSGDRFSSSRGEVAGSQVYIINLEATDNHSVDDYTTIVTPACASPVMTGIGSSLGDLVVDVWNQDGNRVQCTFQFMTLQK